MNQLMRTSMIALAAATLLTAIGIASPAVGQSADKNKKRLKEYNRQLDTLAEKDEWDVSKEDRARAREWLEDASERLARGDTQTASWLLDRTEDLLDLIQVTVQAKQLEADADDQQKQYHQLKDNRLSNLKSEVEELREQKQKLQQELNSLE